MDFQQLLLVLGLAVSIVALLRRMHLPPILGYLICGILVGPYVLGWIPTGDALKEIGEIGLVFLLFTIGIELSLPKLISMRRSLLGLGGMQVLLCTGTAIGIGMLFGLDIPGAFTIAGALALSSTAVAVKQLVEQGELHDPHGRTVLSILLFQDLAAVPFLIIIPTFASDSGTSDLINELFSTIGKGFFVFMVLLAAGRWVLRPLFHWVAAARSSELFMLTALLVALTSAWLTEHLGLSMELGAFLAGVMLAETEYHHQIETDILPFRDILLGVFFITVGMKLSPAVLLEEWSIILMIVIMLTLIKSLIITWLSYTAGLRPVDSIKTGLALAQGGEFGFALLTLAFDHHLLDPRHNQIAIASIVFSIALAPILIRNSTTIAEYLAKMFSDEDLKSTPDISDYSTDVLTDHVIICGYGRVGQTLARFLEQDGIPYIGLDMDPVRLKEASAANEPVLYGDSTSIDILRAIGIEKAKLLLISFDDVVKAKRTIQAVRSHKLSLPILVRSRDDACLESLLEAGATEIVPETLEASLMLVSHMLVLLGHSKEHIEQRVMEEKSNRYAMLRAFFQGGDDENHIEENTSDYLHAVEITSGAYAVGKTIEELTKDDESMHITAFKRGGIKTSMPALDTVIKPEDIIIVCGTQSEVRHAEELLLQG